MRLIFKDDSRTPSLTYICRLARGPEVTLICSSREEYDGLRNLLSAKNSQVDSTGWCDACKERQSDAYSNGDVATAP